jgi:hypothetical protein
MVVSGKRIQTFLNGVAFVDYEAVTIGDEGPIGLQLHAGHHMKMLFRNIQCRELGSADVKSVSSNVPLAWLSFAERATEL